MSKILLINSLDEFTTFYSSSIAANLYKKYISDKNEIWITSPVKLAGICNSADKIICCEKFENSQEFTVYYSAFINSIKDKFDKVLTCEDILYKEILSNGISMNHIYDYTFKAISKLIQESSLTPLLTTKEKYEQYKNDKFTIVIHGRNLDKHPQRNILFTNFIKTALDNNIKIIDLTYKLTEPINHSNYIQYDIYHNNFTYLDQIAVYQNANYVLADGNGAGVPTNICIKCNFVGCNKFGPNLDTWVYNYARCAYNNKTIVMARNEYWKDVSTTYINGKQNFECPTFCRQLISQLAKQKPPEINNFFDISKIVRVGEYI